MSHAEIKPAGRCLLDTVKDLRFCYEAELVYPYDAEVKGNLINRQGTEGILRCDSEHCSNSCRIDVEKNKKLRVVSAIRDIGDGCVIGIKWEDRPE